jgi:hypothetical protein
MKRSANDVSARIRQADIPQASEGRANRHNGHKIRSRSPPSRRESSRDVSKAFSRGEERRHDGQVHWRAEQNSHRRVPSRYALILPA